MHRAFPKETSNEPSGIQCMFDPRRCTDGRAGLRRRPESHVEGLEVTLGSVGTFTDKMTFAQTTVHFLADPKYAWWSNQNGKIIVPSCSTAILGGQFKLDVEQEPGHESSVAHWTLGNLGGASWPLDKDVPECSKHGAPTLCGGDGESKTWQISIPLAKGQTMQHLQAWTSKQGEKSPVKSILFKFVCEEVPPPAPKPTLSGPAAAGLKGVVEKPKGTVPVPGGTTIPADLDVRSVRLDFGFKDANAVEWFKGQPAQKEILFHEITGPGSEVGGAKWGVTQSVTVNGQTFASRGIDSCASVLKLKKVFVRAKNKSTIAPYNGGTTTDLRAQVSGPGSSSFSSTGNIPAIAANVEGEGSVDVANQGVNFFTSGTYAVKADLLAPAAGPTPANNTAQFSLVFKCKTLGGTTWQ